MNLTVATLNLEEGREVDMLPDVVCLAGDVDLLLFQEGKNYHADGQRQRFRAERLLSSTGLDRSLMTAGTGTAMHTLIFWRASRLQPVAHWNPVWPDVFPGQGGPAEFEVEGLGSALTVMSVHWAYWSGDVRLDQAQKLTRFAAPGVPAIIGGDLNSLWPDCPGHREFEPAWDRLPPHKRHHKTLPPGARPGGTLVSDRRALTVFSEAGFTSAGCIAGDMTPTVNDKAGIGQGGRIDHIVLSPALAGCVLPATYAVHVSETGSRASDHRLVSVTLDLDRFAPGTAA